MIEEIFFGIITIFVGAIIIANSAFTERGNLGFVVCLFGMVYFVIGIAGTALKYFGGP